MQPFIYRTFYLINLVFLFTACEKFTEVDPPKNRVVAATVFNSDAGATSAVSGIYSRMMEGSGFASGGRLSVSGLTGVTADEFKFHGTGAVNEFYINSITPANASLLTLWGGAYQYIYTANFIMESLDNSEAVTASTKKQLVGEVKFIRAFCYFYLTNLFGDIPLHLSTDYRVNTSTAKTSQAQVYQQIIKDLVDAQSLLNDKYVTGTNEPTATDRVRPNKLVATAFLARVYLYTKDWVKAEAEATAVINQTSVYSLMPNLDDVFKKGSKEAIWQLMPVTGSNTNDGANFILTSLPTTYYTLTDLLLNSFEAGDVRKSKWIGAFINGSSTYYFPYKYKIRSSSTVDEYQIIFRLAEQFLIRSEARSQQNKISEAQADINVVRNRAGLLNTTANDKPALLMAIEQERRVELFTEWGHRWFDLKRWTRADAVLGALKAPNWQSTDVLYPIPQTEITNNPNITQNMGY